MGFFKTTLRKFGRNMRLNRVCGAALNTVEPCDFPRAKDGGAVLNSKTYNGGQKCPRTAYTMDYWGDVSAWPPLSTRLIFDIKSRNQSPSFSPTSNEVLRVTPPRIVLCSSPCHHYFWGGDRISRWAYYNIYTLSDPCT